MDQTAEAPTTIPAVRSTARNTTHQPPIDSELEPRLAGGVGQGLDPAMIFVASTVEANLVNTGAPGPLGDDAADDRGRRLVAAVGLLRLDLGVERAGRGQRPALGVVDHLGIDVLRAPED